MSVFYTVMFYLGCSAGAKVSEVGPSGRVKETLLAGRSLCLATALMTMTATWVGGGFVNGTAESVATLGLAWAQAPWGYALSLVLGGLLFAKPMRRRHFTTMLDPLTDRFGKKMAALLYLPALTGEIFWTGAVLTALGTTFGFILQIDFSASILLSAFIAILYTSLGGLRGVAKTDVFQLIILILGLMLALPFILPGEGISGVWTKYQSVMGEKASPFPSLSWGDSYYLWWDYALLLIFGGIPWHVYFQRVLSSRDEFTARWLSIGAGGLCLVAAFPAVIIGMVSATTDWGAMGL